MRHMLTNWNRMERNTNAVRVRPQAEQQSEACRCLERVQGGKKGHRQQVE